jgi:hypothetical protein
MNLFWNILDQFTGQAQPQVPSFSTPQAPRTMNYTAPTLPNQKPIQTDPTAPTQTKKSMTLFANEKSTMNQMISDGLSEDEAQNLVKEHRKKLYPNIDLNPVEVAALRQMANDWLTSYEASELLKQSKEQKKIKAWEDFQKRYEKGNFLQKGAYNTLAFAAGNLETIAKYGGNILDFATGWQAGFWEDVKAMEQVTQSPEFSNSTAFKAGTYLPDVAMAVAPVWGIAKAGTLGKSIVQWAKIWGIYGWVNPILQKWSDANIMDIWKWSAVWATIWAAIPVAGKVLSKWADLVKKSGKALYKTAIKPNVQEAEQIIASEAMTLENKAKIKKIESSSLTSSTKAKKIESLTWKYPITRADTSLKYGITGTEKWIGVKWKAESSKLWNETISPAIQKSKAQHNIDDMFTRAEKVIEWEKSVLRKQELMDWLQALKEDYIATGKKVFTTGDIQAEKSMLDEFTPSKIWKWKEVAQGYTQAKNTLANIFREQVREDLWKVGIKNAKELYWDYANLSQLKDIWVKWITEGGLKGWFGTFWSTVYDKVATPVKTVWGKYIYKLGNWVEYVWPKWMDTIWKYLKSKWYKVAGGNIINLSKNVRNPLIRAGVLYTSPDTRMDRAIVKPKKLK